MIAVRKAGSVVVTVSAGAGVDAESEKRLRRTDVDNVGKEARLVAARSLKPGESSNRGERPG